MKIIKYIVLVSFIFNFSCADRNPLTGSDFDPTLGGNYTDLRGIISGTLLKCTDNSLEVYPYLTTLKI